MSEVIIHKGALYKCIGEIPETLPTKCIDCPYSEYYDADEHVGYGCYDRHDFVQCNITDNAIDLTKNNPAKLFEQCPITVTDKE